MKITQEESNKMKDYLERGIVFISDKYSNKRIIQLSRQLNWKPSRFKSALLQAYYKKVGRRTDGTRLFWNSREQGTYVRPTKTK
jgi:hypothetical protein